MSAQHSTPWCAEERNNGRRGRLRREWWAVLDRNGFFVAEGLDETTAREIVSAENELDRLNEDIESWRRGYIKARTERNAYLLDRDRLLDLVRRLADDLERFHIVGERDRALLREARAALKRKGDRR